ncbi:MAG: YybH family protein [bacterium]
MTNRRFFSYSIVLILLSCCQQQSSHQANLDAEKAKIRDLTQEWLRAESDKNLDSSLTFIAEDGVYMANDWPTLYGHEQISRFLSAAFKMPMGPIAGGTESIEIAASGDLAYEIGQTEVPFSFADGDTVFKSHYIVVWQKKNGQWKAVATSISGTR